MFFSDLISAILFPSCLLIVLGGFSSDWLGRKSANWSILCRVGFKTLTQ